MAMVEKFTQSKFSLSVAHSMLYDDATQFNENNVTSYLSELEEYIALLLTYIAYQQEHNDAAISALSLEKMFPKEFDKSQVNDVMVKETY